MFSKVDWFSKNQMLVHHCSMLQLHLFSANYTVTISNFYEERVVVVVPIPSLVRNCKVLQNPRYTDMARFKDSSQFDYHSTE